MKMRKYFVMALVALGATAAFSSCRKDDVYDGPKVEFRDANNKKITEFDENSFGTKGISIYVTLGDKSVSLDRLEISVVADDGTILQPKKLQTEEGKGGDAAGTRFTTIKSLDELKLTTNELSRKGLRIEAKATDSQKKETVAKCMYKKAGESGGETPKETLMQVGKENAYINNITGPNDALGSYSFTDGMAKESSASDAERQLVNMSEAGKGFVADFNSKAGYKFHKVVGSLKYDGATVEGVKKELEGKTPADEIKGLEKGNLFVAAKDMDEGPFYLVQVTEVKSGKTTSYIDKTGNVKEGSADTNGGYMKFRYKKSN